MLSLVAFDLDGVLYSSERFLADAYREAIGRVNDVLPGAFPAVPTTEEIFAHMGWPVDVMAARIFPSVSEEARKQLLVETLDAIVRRVRAGRGEVFDGVPEVLAELAARGLTLAVASNGRRPYLDAVLETHGLASFFVPLEASTTGNVLAKSEILRRYMTRHGAAPNATLMVGDRSSDVEAARAAGVPFVGCDYGFGHRGELDGAGPVIDSMRELPALIASMG